MNNSSISITRQCELLGLPRSSFYYQSHRTDNKYNEYLMRLIDEEYTRHPFYGYPRMTQWLRRQGHQINRKRVASLMRRMGIEAIYPKRRTSQAQPGHKKYPYLLRGLIIDRPDQVWASDITYLRMNKGFAYLVAIMDWFSRYVLSWSISNTMESEFCRKSLGDALLKGRPEIFNTDQGSQFTSNEFTCLLKEKGIRVSMDGRGRVFDNIFVERLWRSVKYEEIYLS